LMRNDVKKYRKSLIIGGFMIFMCVYGGLSTNF